MTHPLNHIKNIDSCNVFNLTHKVFSFTHGLNSPELEFDHHKIVLSSHEKTDFFQAPDESYSAHNAPLLLKCLDNTLPFVLSCKITPAFKSKYDAGGLFILENNHKWLKFVFEMDDLHHTRVVSVNTNHYSDDCNHEKVADESIYLKIASNTQQIGCYYSKVQDHWTMGRLCKNTFSASIYIGLTTQSPSGQGNSTIFDEINFQYESLSDFRLGK